MYELRQYHTYILASKPNGLLYTGFSGDLKSRMNQHVNEEYEGFTKKYYNEFNNSMILSGDFKISSTDLFNMYRKTKRPNKALSH